MKTKKTKDLKKGDRIRVEFGIENNWVNIELLEDVERKDDGSWKITAKYINTGNHVEMYSLYAEEEIDLIE